MNQVTQQNYTLSQFFILPYHYLKYYMMYEGSRRKPFPETQCCDEVTADGNIWNYIMAKKKG